MVDSCDKNMIRSLVRFEGMDDHPKVVLELRDENFASLPVEKILIKEDEVSVLYDGFNNFGADEEIKKAFIKPDGFLDRLKSILVEKGGFSDVAVESIEPAGWGLQARNKATFYAKEIAREVARAIDGK